MIEEVISRAEAFRQADPTGVVMSLTAIGVVLSVLAALFLIFWGLGQLFRRLAAPRVAKATVAAEPAVEVSGDVYAAIAVALYRYSRDLHDVENTVLTINRAAKVYSPWSSKIYGLRRLPNKR